MRDQSGYMIGITNGNTDFTIGPYDPVFHRIVRYDRNVVHA